jgi:hypothetical protein
MPPPLRRNPRNPDLEGDGIAAIHIIAHVVSFHHMVHPKSRLCIIFIQMAYAIHATTQRRGAWLTCPKQVILTIHTV